MDELANDLPTSAAAHDDLGAIDPDVAGIRPLAGRAVAFAGLGAILLAAGVFAIGWLPHARRKATAAAFAERATTTLPSVTVMAPKRAPATVDLVLPGDVRADQATSIYARTSGYLQSQPPGIDIGSRVEAGQVLAEISAPELAAELARADADRQQAEAARQRARDDLAFQQASIARYEGFAKQGGLTSQQLDERRQELASATTGLASAEAAVAAATASQQRLADLLGFAHVTAPFSGIITYRGYDVGAMIAATDLAAGKELFRIVATDAVRVRVAVPQALAASVRIGQDAELVLSDSGQRTFAGKVARSAGAVDPTTRTMTIEVDVQNPDGAILPGTYGQVRLRLERANPGWLVPSSALMVTANGTQVAEVVDGHVRLKTLAIERDQGALVEVANDFTGEERIVENPGVRLAEGTAVGIRKSGEAAEQSR